jgi:hypothetical protein
LSVAEDSEGGGGGGVVNATVTEFKRHPYIIVGCVVALVLIIALSRGSGASKAQNFSFSYGPTDAQMKNQTALAVSENANQTAVSIAGIQAQTYGDYFSYLTSAGNTQASTAVQTAKIAADTANYKVSADDGAAVAIANVNATVAQSGQAWAAAIAGKQADSQTAIAYKQADTSAVIANLNDAAANYQAGLLSNLGWHQADMATIQAQVAAGTYKG